MVSPTLIPFFCLWQITPFFEDIADFPHRRSIIHTGCCQIPLQSFNNINRTKFTVLITISQIFPSLHIS